MSPVRKKSEQEAAAKVPTTRKVAAAPRKRAPRKAAQPAVTPEERNKMIELEAYFMAEKDGFRGDPQSYWLAAEAVVEARLTGKKKK